MTNYTPGWPQDEEWDSSEVIALSDWLDEDTVLDGQPIQRLAAEYDLYCREHGLHYHYDGPLLTNRERTMLLVAFGGPEGVSRQRRWKDVLQHLRSGNASHRFQQVVADLIGFGAFSARALESHKTKATKEPLDLRKKEKQKPRGFEDTVNDAFLALKSDLVWRVLRRTFPDVTEKKIDNLAFTIFVRRELEKGDKFLEKRDALKQAVSNGIDKRKPLRHLFEAVRLNDWEN